MFKRERAMSYAYSHKVLYLLVIAYFTCMHFVKQTRSVNLQDLVLHTNFAKIWPKTVFLDHQIHKFHEFQPFIHISVQHPPTHPPTHICMETVTFYNRNISKGIKGMSLKSNTDTTKHYTYINSRKENRNKPKPKGQKLSPPKPHNLLACAGR